jgi:hypothetical protein
MSQRVTVHDPRGYPPQVTGKQLAQRLPNLAGKRLYLVDCLFDNSAVFMAQLRDWLRQQFPELLTENIRPRESWVDDPEMRATVAGNGDAAILGVGL